MAMVVSSRTARWLPITGVDPLAALVNRLFHRVEPRRIERRAGEERIDESRARGGSIGKLKPAKVASQASPLIGRQPLHGVERVFIAVVVMVPP